MSSSRGSSDPGIELAAPVLLGGLFTTDATWEAQPLGLENKMVQCVQLVEN